MSSDKDASLADLRKELEMISRLLTVGLLQLGLSQRDLAKALGVNQSTISRTLSRNERNPTGRKK